MTYTRLSSLVFILAILIAPIDASAATKKVSCSLTVYTPRGEAELKKKETVLVKEDESIRLAWTGKNATKATKGGKAIALSGSEDLIVTKSGMHTYRFTNGSKKAECAAALKVADGSITVTSLTTDSTKPTLTGTAKGTKSVSILVEDKDGKKIYSKTSKLKRGKWEAKMTKAIPIGAYLVTLSGTKDMKLNTISTSTLNILPKGSSGGGSVSASSIPLLMGGNAAPGSSVPIAYIKLSNTGSKTANLKGFTLMQNGTGSTDAVIGFTTSDDKGGSRTTIGGTEGTKQFKNGTAYVPLSGTIAPQQIRIFTLKAILSRNSGSYAGQQLKIDVSAVDVDGGARGTFPIRGTTLTLTR